MPKKRTEVNETRELESWLMTSKEGDVVLYHTGQLMKDRQVNLRGDFSRNKTALSTLADRFYHYYECGDISLYQKRLSEGCYEYYAQRLGR